MIAIAVLIAGLVPSASASSVFQCTLAKGSHTPTVTLTVHVRGPVEAIAPSAVRIDDPSKILGRQAITQAYTRRADDGHFRTDIIMGGRESGTFLMLMNDDAGPDEYDVAVGSLNRRNPSLVGTCKVAREAVESNGHEGMK